MLVFNRREETTVESREVYTEELYEENEGITIK